VAPASLGAKTEGKELTRRVVVLAPEPIRPKMAGMGIRALELARVLAENFEVRLLVPNAPAEAPSAKGVTVVEAPPGSEAFHSEIRDCRAALVSGHAANYFFLAAPHVPVAVDWYDPFLIENFQYLESLGENVEANDRAAWNLALCRADLFICASEEQRLFYLGMLVQGGRVHAGLLQKDRGAESLVRTVPFGVDPAPPADPAASRRLIGGSPGDPVLYFGGLYDWHDPEPLFQIWPALLEEFPTIRLIFSENPNPESTPQLVYRSAVATAERRGWTGRSIFFLPWTPYEQRSALYGASSLAVCACRPGLETRLSFRTRLLDAAAFGLPSISIEGGSLARELAASGAGESVNDAAELLESIRAHLRSEPRRREASRRAREFVTAFSWSRVVRPLADFFEHAKIASRLDFPERRSGPAFRLLRRGR
jgi:glycosyltransferase involved in cell wall biosynthesis